MQDTTGRMNIAVNTRFLIKDKLEGIGWFTYETLKRITQNHPEHHFYFLFDRDFDNSFLFSDNVTPIVLWPQARHPILWYYWFEVAVPNILKRLNADLFLSTDGFLSLKTDTKQVLVIHDLAFEHFPKHVPGLQLKYYSYYSPKFAQKANRIATVSEFSKRDIVNRYHIAADKVDVVYNGVNTLFQTNYNGEVKTAQERFATGNDYFIYVGSIHPRKNIDNLFKAFDEFKTRNNNSGAKLVIAGRKAWKTQSTFTVYNNLRYKDDIVFLGHTSPDDLSKLVNGALAMVYVSHFEGFGIPILEAMNAGVPVITSKVSSMPEVAGEAGVLVDPSSHIEIAMAMDEVYNNTKLRKQLVNEGNIQRQKFSWDKTANLLWQSMAKVL